MSVRFAELKILMIRYGDRMRINEEVCRLFNLNHPENPMSRSSGMKWIVAGHLQEFIIIFFIYILVSFSTFTSLVLTIFALRSHQSKN